MLVALGQPPLVATVELPIAVAGVAPGPGWTHVSEHPEDRSALELVLVAPD